MPLTLIEVVTRYIIKSLVLVNAVWLYFLIYGATTLRDSVAHKTISVGPLIVNHLDKSLLSGGGYTLQLNFASGFLWLELIGVAVGCLAAMIHVYLTKHKQKDNNRV